MHPVNPGKPQDIPHYGTIVRFINWFPEGPQKRPEGPDDFFPGKAEPQYEAYPAKNDYDGLQVYNLSDVQAV